MEDVVPVFETPCEKECTGNVPATNPIIILTGLLIV